MTKAIAMDSGVSLDSDRSSVQDYIMLMKPRVMSLVVFTSYCGLHLSPGSIHPIIAFTAILLISIGSGSAAVINMWYDRDIDIIMERTKKRPIARGVIHPDEALVFGVIIGTLSVLLMLICVNILSSILLATTILYYIFIYTAWVKRSSVQNVVIGGVAGALPPMIGWSAVSNNISWESFILFAIIFTWTPPHSWALSLFRLKDYESCNIPMMPVVKGALYTKKYMVFYTNLMLIVSIVPYFLGMSGVIYLVMSLVLGIIFCIYLALLFKDDNLVRAKKLFVYSIIYLFGIFLSLVMF